MFGPSLKARPTLFFFLIYGVFPFCGQMSPRDFSSSPFCRRLFNGRSFHREGPLGLSAQFGIYFKVGQPNARYLPSKGMQFFMYPPLVNTCALWKKRLTDYSPAPYLFTLPFPVV